MFTVLVVLAILGGVAYRATTPEERARFLEQYIQPAALAMDRVVFATEPFRAALRARTPWIVLTPALAALNALVFVVMLFGDRPFSEPGTLLDWGASQGPHTTNGEWWRLATAMFVHAGMFHLLFNLIGLAQVGELLERLVGPVVVACVYVTAGVLASLVSISEYPLAVHIGASAAVFGLYGLLLAVTAWGMLRRTGVTIPLAVFQSLAPSAAMFFLYSVVTDGIASTPNFTGFIVGLVMGLALTKNAGERKPALHPLAIAMAAAAVVIVYVALPLRGLMDIRPEIAQLVTSEDRTANVYRLAVGRFTKKQRPIDTRVLTDLIDGTILPQLRAARARVDALDRVLAEHQPLVASASEYLRLREASWRLRAEGLRKGSMSILREAERIEQASLGALHRLRGMQVTIDVHT